LKGEKGEDAVSLAFYSYFKRRREEGVAPPPALSTDCLE